MSRAPSYKDWYSQSAFVGIPKQDRIFHAGPVHLINVAPPAGAVVEPPIPEYALHLLLQTGSLLRVGFNLKPRWWLAVSPGVYDPGSCGHIL